MKKVIKNFYVVEGMDGSGKTTFCNNLKASLEKSGRSCIILNESEDPAFTSIIRESLKKDNISSLAEAYLFAAARANCIGKMNNFFKQHPDGIVIFDRYIPSSLVYQSEKLSSNTIKNINNEFSFPSAIFYLKVPAEVANSRILSRHEKEIEKFEKLPLLQKWEKKYDQVLLQENSDLYFLENNENTSEVSIIRGFDNLSGLYKENKKQTSVVVLDASKEPDEILDEAFSKYEIL